MTFHRPQALSTRPTVSVVVPCYRYGNYLPFAVGSVLAQTDVDVDVLIVDDASPDDSAAVAYRLADEDPRVSVLVHSTNMGHIATYNDGLARAKGDYVMLLSADDAITPGSLARSTALMEAHPSVGFVYGYSPILGDGLVTDAGRTRSWSVWDGGRWLGRMCRNDFNPVRTPEVVMRREAWEQIGAYDSTVPHAADMLLWFQTARNWDIGRVNGPKQAQYRVHGENMHLTMFAGMMRDLHEQRAVFSIVFPDRDSDPDAATMFREARTAMAVRALRLAAVAERVGENVLADEYRQFAVETAPGGQSWVDAGARRRADRIESAPWTFVRKVKTHLAWRRWRRYGT